ncbi:MAG: LLM class flavin-dependent oxidoreductase [Actinomycetota bacterium]|nr:LLM class flavin-dependent oxidoreductase [Actinomycetota bacterium]
MTLALSVLDQCPVPAGSTGADALRHTLDLARAAEALGYRRYWLAEHHNTTSLAATAPEILVAAVAAATSRIRVGSGGVMLSHYSPLKVAETFRTLAALHPGRIDLGVGRTPGADPVTEAALQYLPGVPGDERYDEKVVDLVGFVRGNLDAGHPFESVRALPDGGPPPELWLLGSSSHSGAIAAYLGLPFAFAHFITSAFGPQVMAAYHRGFQPADDAAAPRAAVAVSVLCAETDDEADRLARSADVWRLRPDGAGRGPLLSPEDAAAVTLTALDETRIAQGREAMVVGGPDRVRDRLTAVAGAFDVEELLVVTICHDPVARLRSYRLLAEAFSLGARGASTTAPSDGPDLHPARP